MRTQSASRRCTAYGAQGPLQQPRAQARDGPSCYGVALPLSNGGCYSAPDDVCWMCVNEGICEEQNGIVLGEEAAARRRRVRRPTSASRSCSADAKEIDAGATPCRESRAGTPTCRSTPTPRPSLLTPRCARTKVAHALVGDPPLCALCRRALRWRTACLCAHPSASRRCTRAWSARTASSSSRATGTLSAGPSPRHREQTRRRRRRIAVWNRARLRDEQPASTTTPSSPASPTPAAAHFARAYRRRLSPARAEPFPTTKQSAVGGLLGGASAGGTVAGAGRLRRRGRALHVRCGARRRARRARARAVGGGLTPGGLTRRTPKVAHALVAWSRPLCEASTTPVGALVLLRRSAAAKGARWAELHLRRGAARGPPGRRRRPRPGARRVRRRRGARRGRRRPGLGRAGRGVGGRRQLPEVP